MKTQEMQKDIREYWNILQKRRSVIISFAGAVLLGALVFNFSSTRIYEGTSRIEISKENQNLVSIQEVMAIDTTGLDYYQTQYKIIESRAVARKVIDQLHLEKEPEFKPGKSNDFFSNVKSWFKGSVIWVRNLLNSGDSENANGNQTGSDDSELIDDFIERVSVTPVRSTRLVDISVEAKDSKLAAKMSNTLVQAYIDNNLEIKLSAAKNAVEWLSQRAGEQRKKVEASEKALLKYKEENNIITNFSSDAEQITEQKLAQLNSKVIDAEAARVEAETRYLQAIKLKDSPDMLNSIPEVIDNKLVGEIKKMEVDFYSRISELSKKYGKNHPKMLAINLELEDLQKRKITVVNQIINSLNNEFELALAREKSLKKAMEGQKIESLRMNKMAIQYGVLQREAESTKNMYDMLINRFKETSLTEEMKTGNIRIIDKAEIPRKPVRPRTTMNVFLAMVFGLSLGVGLAFLVESLDNTIKSPDDIKHHLGIPFIGTIPAYALNEGPEGISGVLVSSYAPKSIASESYIGIKTGIQLSSVDAPPQVIMITSAGVREGKTTTATNLAITFAKADSPTVLIDCDMRKPQIHRIFRSKNNVGLSHLLAGRAGIDEAVHATNIKGLDIIPCGPIPPNPSEMINSKGMETLIGELKGKYANIIIDTPPISAVSDAMALSQFVDGTILVIRASETPRKIIQNMVDQLKTVNCRILGSILNGVSDRHNGYYYQQYQYYYGASDTPPNKSSKKKSVA